MEVVGDHFIGGPLPPTLPTYVSDPKKSQKSTFLGFLCWIDASDDPNKHIGIDFKCRIMMKI